MDDTINYEALYETVRHENERLRLNLLKLRTASTFAINWQAVRDFAQKNYTVLLVAILAVYYIGHLLIDTIEMLWRTRR